MYNSFFSKVFMWLFIGVLLTFASGYYLINNQALMQSITSSGAYIVIVIIQLVLCIVLVARVSKMNTVTAKILYVLYTLFTGVTLSSLLASFQVQSVMIIFLVTAVLFAIFGLIGAFTKVDLTKFGTYALMALIACLVLFIINIFIKSAALDLGLCIVFVLIFIFYIAYDVQRVVKMNSMDISNDNYAILGAFTLYLDFINLFIELLKIFGKRND